MKFNKASLIIPTFNKKERLEIVLNAFKHQHISRDDYEVILINDGSAESTTEMIESLNINYTFRHVYQKNSGRSSARNFGIKIASNPLLIFCDDDTIPSKDFIINHLNAHQNSNSRVVHGKINNLPYLKFFRDPSKGILYDKVKTENTHPAFLNKHLLSFDENIFDKLDAQSKLTLFEKQIKFIFEREIKEIQWLGFTGGNVSVSKDFIEKAGLFDEDFGVTWGGEDLEMGYRLFLAGGDFIYSDEACNYHIAHHRCDFQSDINASMEVFYAKHNHSVILHLKKLLTGEIKEVVDFLSLIKEDGNKL